MANENAGWVSALKSMLGGKRHQLAGDAEGATAAAKAVGNISWTEFQLLVSEAFRQQGCTVTEAGADDVKEGVDLIAHKDQRSMLLQTRHWKAQSLGPADIRELADTVAIRGAAGGYVLTSGRFTVAATEYAKDKSVHLADGAELLQMLRAAQATMGRRLSPWEPGAPDATSSWFVPQCPVCKSPMLLRSASEAADATPEYWGCSRAPECQGTRSLQDS